MKIIDSLLRMFIGSVIIMVIIGLAGIVSAYILDFLKDKIDNIIYKIGDE